MAEFNEIDPDIVDESDFDTGDSSSDGSSQPVEDSRGKSSDSAVSPQLVEQLRRSAIEQAQASLLNDPELGPILKARQEGRKYVKEAEYETFEDPLDKLDLTTADSRDVARTVRDSTLLHVNKAVKASLRESIDQLVKPLQEEVASLKRAAGSIQQSQVQREIEQARRANPDFDVLKPAMAALANEHPTLNLQQLLALARVSANKGKRAASFSTERPSRGAIAGRAAKYDNRQPNKPASFRDALSDALKETRLEIGDDD